MLTLKKLQEEINKLNRKILDLKGAIDRRQIAEILLEKLKRDFNHKDKANKTLRIKIINENDEVITDTTIKDMWED